MIIPSEYIVTKRFKSNSLSGNVNLPYGTKCSVFNNIITYKGNPICLITSQDAYNYFSRNDDHQGKQRRELVKKIHKSLNSDSKWARLWKDHYSQKFRRKDHEDYWIWNYDFYNATINDLKYILNLINN